MWRLGWSIWHLNRLSTTFKFLQIVICGNCNGISPVTVPLPLSHSSYQFIICDTFDLTCDSLGTLPPTLTFSFTHSIYQITRCDTFPPQLSSQIKISNCQYGISPVKVSHALWLLVFPLPVIRLQDVTRFHHHFPLILSIWFPHLWQSWRAPSHFDF